VRRLELGATVGEVARACEVNGNVLHRWRQKCGKAVGKPFRGRGERTLSEPNSGRIRLRVVPDAPMECSHQPEQNGTFTDGNRMATSSIKPSSLCRRYLRCACLGGKRITLWPLNDRQLPGTTPELEYLYATWGTRVPYRRAAAVLGDLLPICTGIVSHATLRRHTLIVGARLDQRVIEPDEYDWQPLSPPQHIVAPERDERFGLQPKFPTERSKQCSITTCIYHI
jgi:hypothetical protein